MAGQTIEVQQEQPVSCYGPAVITVEVGNQFAVSPATIRLTVRYRDVDYCDLSEGDTRKLIGLLQQSLAELELQTPKQCYRCGLDATPGQTEGWVLNRGTHGAGWHCPDCPDEAIIVWVGPANGNPRVCSCDKCGRRVAYLKPQYLLDAGWVPISAPVPIDAVDCWSCPACKEL